jgi:hypothetical protein
VRGCTAPPIANDPWAQVVRIITFLANIFPPQQTISTATNSAGPRSPAHRYPRNRFPPQQTPQAPRDFPDPILLGLATSKYKAGHHPPLSSHLLALPWGAEGLSRTLPPCGDPAAAPALKFYWTAPVLADRGTLSVLTRWSWRPEFVARGRTSPRIRLLPWPACYIHDQRRYVTTTSSLHTSIGLGRLGYG